MKYRALLACAIGAFAAGCAAPSAAPTSDGLVARHSARLDQVYVRPNADLRSYRKVFIAPVPVELRSDYSTQRHGYNRGPSLDPLYKEAEAVRMEAAELLHGSLVDAFKAAGYEILEAPQSDSLRVSARISELFINAPDRLSPSRKRMFTRDAGEAKLLLEASDEQTGETLVRVSHHAIAREVVAINIAEDASNEMWFDALFHRWAADCVAVLGK